MSEEIRHIPWDETEERNVIGKISIDPNENMAVAIDLGVTADTFYLEINRIIFSVILDHFKNGTAPSFESVVDAAVERSTIPRDTVFDVFAQTYGFIGTSPFKTSIRRILDLAVLRRIVRTCNDTVQSIYNKKGKISDIVTQFELDALTIGESAQKKEEHKTSYKAVLGKLAKYLQDPTPPGMPTGIRKLDQVTGGLHKGEVTIFAARPAVGKTSIACTIAANMAISGESSVAYFASEGTDVSLIGRMASIQAGVDQRLIREKQTSKKDIAAILKMRARADDVRLEIDDRVSNATEICSRIRRFHQKQPLDVVIVDYIQKLLPCSRDELADPRALIRNATNLLHQTCKSLNIALVLLAQLNRQKTDHDPQMHHLADSSSLEKDGDVIVFVANMETGEDNMIDVEAPREVLFRVGKNRHGRTGDLNIMFNPSRTLFY